MLRWLRKFLSNLSYFYFHLSMVRVNTRLRANCYAWLIKQIINCKLMLTLSWNPKLRMAPRAIQFDQNQECFLGNLLSSHNKCNLTKVGSRDRARGALQAWRMLYPSGIKEDLFHPLPAGPSRHTLLSKTPRDIFTPQKVTPCALRF